MNFKHLDNVVYYKMEENNRSVPKITDSIRIDDKLCVQLFHNKYPIPLSSWLRYKSCTLNSAIQLENFKITDT